MPSSIVEPTISVVVPTRNRPDHAVACAKELLRAEGIREILFIDQSDDDSTEAGLSALGGGIRCVRSHLRGATNGRNLGIELSVGSLVAFTDDDCRVAPDWAVRIAEIFRTDQEVAVVCGRVRVPEELLRIGFTTGFEPDVRTWVRRFPPPDRDWGITANMTARREVFARLGRFDPFLGVGAPLLSGEEPDLLFRVLKAGLKVINAREVEVTHLGVRLFGAESTDLWRTYGMGTAAALVKHIRLGDADAARLYLHHLMVMAQVMATNLVSGKRPLGLRYTWSLLSGAAASFRFGVDRRRCEYVHR